MNEQQQLDRIRTRIDELDCEIQHLISERATCAQQVGHIKQAQGSAVRFYRPEREARILREVLARNEGPLDGEEMARLFREIMSACLALEHPMQIAFLGPEGTFTQAAVYKHFGHSVTTLPLSAIDEVFREVESGSAHYGVVPVENSTEGVVNHTLDMLLNSPLKICGEVDLRIHDHLMGRVASLDEVDKIYSHSQSLAQCREWLDSNLPGISRQSVSSNAEAARRAGSEAGAVAVAGEVAAELYELDILARNIEDHPNNTTRFLIIGVDDAPPSGVDKTSLLVSTRNKPGALFQLLNPLARNGISMTRIESRPSRQGMWEYVFFFDLDGHKREEKVAAALQELKEEASLFKVLGSYPKAVI